MSMVQDLIEKLTVTQLMKKYPTFIESKYQHGVPKILPLDYVLNYQPISWRFIEMPSSIPVVPKVCTADLKGCMTSSQENHGLIFVMTTLKLAYFFHYKNNILLKTIEELL